MKGIRLSIMVLVMFMLAWQSASGHELALDTLAVEKALTDKEVADSIEFASKPWYKQLWDSGFQIHDARINYPKFPRFCLKVYDWGDRTFNSYNPEYVVSTHKNWKLTGKSYNWMESYIMIFPNNQKLHLRSDVYCDIGGYISFMAVSLGYTAKLNNMFGNGNNTRSNFNFSFQTSLFTANIDITKSHGGTRIVTFGKRGEIPLQFGDVMLSSLSGDAYYYFNHWKYSQAAAYCFSKYQLKSSGSAVLGFAFNHQNIDLSFDDMPEYIKEQIPSLQPTYHFKYTDYTVLGGYAYNWVPRPRTWLLNVTVLPSLGYKHAYKGSSDGLPHMVSTNIRGSFSVVYNHRALFLAMIGRADLHFYFAKSYTFFNSIESLSLKVGMRF